MHRYIDRAWHAEKFDIHAHDLEVYIDWKCTSKYH